MENAITNNLHGEKVYFDFVNSQNDYIKTQDLFKTDDFARLSLDTQFNPVLDFRYDDYIKDYRDGVNKMTNIPYLIKKNDDKKIIGMCGFHSTDFIARNTKLFIFIHKDFQRQGFGFDTLNILKKIGFLNYNFHKISLTYFEFNEGVEEFYKKAGFVKEAELKEMVFVNGKYYSEISMATFKSDFEKE